MHFDLSSASKKELGPIDNNVVDNLNEHALWVPAADWLRAMELSDVRNWSKSVYRQLLIT